MEGIKWNIRALAANKKISIEALAELADISVDHLKAVSSGRATMTARDLIHLSNATGVAPHYIDYGD